MFAVPRLPGRLRGSTTLSGPGISAGTPSKSTKQHAGDDSLARIISLTTLSQNYVKALDLIHMERIKFTTALPLHYA